MKPNRPLFLQSKQVLVVQDQKVFNKMFISTWMHKISIAFSPFYKFELEKSIGQVDLLCIPSRSWCCNLRIRFAGPLPRDIGVRYLYVVGLTAVPGQLSVRWYNSEVNPGDYSKEIPESGKQMSQPFSRHRCILWALTLFSLILSSIMTIFILVVSLTNSSLWWRSSRCSLTLLSFSQFLRYAMRSTI